MELSGNPEWRALVDKYTEEIKLLVSELVHMDLAYPDRLKKQGRLGALEEVVGYVDENLSRINAAEVRKYNK